MSPYAPRPVPTHVPEKLTITLWDFSWYVRTGPGEPFEDLDRAFAEAVDRGYNTIRICAMPYLLSAVDWIAPPCACGRSARATAAGSAGTTWPSRR